MGTLTRRLGDILDDELHLVGRKTLGLAQLARAGFEVPDGICVTTEAFAPIRESIGTDVEDPTHALARMASLPFVGELTETVAAETRGYLGEAPVAVRSSAVLEDLPAASFAGQYETFLNVSSPDVAASLRKCWASIWSRRLVSYCARNRIPHEKIRMAVLVQKMVPAEVSGVLFTLNPLSGVDTEMLLEAAWGLGEGLVSGRVSPDRFVLDVRSRQVLSAEVGEKRTRVVPCLGGTREVEVEPAESRAALPRPHPAATASRDRTSNPGSLRKSTGRGVRLVRRQAIRAPEPSHHYVRLLARLRRMDHRGLSRRRGRRFGLLALHVVSL